MVAPLTTRVKGKLRDILSISEPGYRLYLKHRHGVKKPTDTPVAGWHNSVLQSAGEWKSATEQARQLGLPSHSDLQKNWDSLAALDYITRNVPRSGAILDAGAELYSSILPWLFLYGYRKLTGINLGFSRTTRRGPIRYEPGDITKTRFPDRSFDAVTCLSVIEHGVPLRDYFLEMARILVPGGILITSTDYWITPVDTLGAVAWGQPVHVFTAKEIESALDLARSFGLETTGPVGRDCSERAVKWEGFAHEYTFLMFTLRKRPESISRLES